MVLSSFTYGKQRVRALVVRRGVGGHHAVHEIEASVMLQGDFADTYLTGDNGKVVATDTIKNTVQVLAYLHLGSVLEDFADVIAGHFLEKYAGISQVEVGVTSRPWDRVATPQGLHPHTFERKGGGHAFSRVERDRTSVVLRSGVAGLLLLKSTGSGFKGFPRCDYTTLPETDDRIMATEMTATWTFAQGEHEYVAANTAITDALVQTFAGEFSPSIQNTLYLMGQAALAAVPGISDIHMTMPNKHYLPVDLVPFHIQNQNVLFLPTDEPHGQIEALISR